MYLVSLPQAFGQSFLQPDIAIFRQNLESLEALNQNHKLYHKVFRIVYTVTVLIKICY